MESSSTPSTSWTTQYLSRPSALELRNRLELQLGESPCTTSPNTPYAIQVTYQLGSAAWRSKTKAWHLAAPSSSSVLSLCVDALVKQKILVPGQIVATSCIKLIGQIEQNVLTVCITPLDTECTLDAPNQQYKLLKWFLEKSNIEGREPTKAAFRNLLKNLRKKRSRAKGY